MTALHLRFEKDCQDYINALVDADMETKARARGGIGDRDITEVAPDGSHVIGHNWSAPWINPPWEEEVHFLPEGS